MKVIKMNESSLNKDEAIKQAQELLADSHDADAVIYGWRQGNDIVYVPPFAVTNAELADENKRRGMVYALHKGRKQRLNASFKFQRVNEDFLTEAIEDMKKYYPNIPDEDFMTYIELDPTYRKGSDRAGTYAKWILTLANSGKIDDMGHMKDLLTRFEDSKNDLINKDISRYKSMVEVEDMLNDENSYKEKTHRQEVRQRQKERSHVDIDKDAEKVYEDSKWTIYIPKTYAASCKLGQGTSWCTASTENDYYYNMYKDEYGGDYYIVISKSNPNEKYQFHFESGQFMDAKDVEIDIDKFFRNNPQVQKFFADIHKDAIKELIVDGKITIPVSKFMEVYRENYHSRDEIDADFIEAALNGDISEYSISWDFDIPDIADIYNYINDENTDKLHELGVEDVSDGDDYPDNVYQAVETAYYDGSLIGTETDVNNSVLGYLNGSAPLGTTATIDYDGNIILSIEDEDKFISKVSIGFNSDGIKTTVARMIADKFHPYEPRYGFYGFDEGAFNERLADELAELE